MKLRYLKERDQTMAKSFESLLKTYQVSNQRTECNKKRIQVIFCLFPFQQLRDDAAGCLIHVRSFISSYCNVLYLFRLLIRRSISGPRTAFSRPFYSQMDNFNDTCGYYMCHTGRLFSGIFDF